MTGVFTQQPGAFMGFVHRRRRGAELFLLVLALAVGVGAYAAVGLGVQGEVPPGIVAYGGWLAALIITAHVVVRLVAPYADPVLLPVVAALNGLGLAVIHRLDLAYEAAGEKHDFAQQQLTWMSLGVVLFIATLLILRDHRTLQRFTYTAGLLAIVLLLLPLVPGLGTTVNGARIWISVGPFSFQPGEVAKVLLVIAFAGYLVVHRDALALAGRRLLFIDLPRGRDLGPILAMWLVSLGVLVFQRDLGSSLLFFGLFLVMLYVATERPGWLVVGGLLFGLGAFLGYLQFSHVQLRVNIWLDPMAYYDESPGSGQLVESMFGMGWGGLVGRGFGGGTPQRIPYAESDFIIGAIGEELGLTGVMAVILIYGIMVERALRAALVCRDGFGKLLAVGLAGVLALQVFVVIGGVTRLIPLTGLTTPFLSYGGSSLVANWVIVALLLRVSDQARRPVPVLGTDDDADSEATQVVKLAAMNKPIRTISVFCLLLFLALMVNATYLQYVEADALNDNPRNRRIIEAAFSRERGAILVGRDPIAESIPSDDRYDFQRVYGQPFKYAPLTGAFSYFSQTGIERSQNEVLSGDDERLFVTRLVDLIGNSSPKGGSVQLTIDPAAQTAAWDGIQALGPGTEGAVVALEPATGKVLAMVSSPSYDPNLLASHDFDAVIEESNRLEDDESEPLINRSIQTTLPPGSTFKLVTAAAAIENGLYTTGEDLVPAGPTYQLPLTEGPTGLIDNGGRDCGTKKITFTQALANSCNTTFLAIADELGVEKMQAQAEAFGFNSEYLDDPPLQAESRYPGDLDRAQTAMSGIGQSEVAATPLQMAMVAAGIANGGIVMKPYTVDEVTSPELDVLDKTEPAELTKAVEPSTAAELTRMMVETVNVGTATNAQIPGIEVAGKTGTAQSTPDRPPYAWFVSFAPAIDPQVAVAVLVEASSTPREEIGGNVLGAPIAKSVMEAVLR